MKYFLSVILAINSLAIFAMHDDENAPTKDEIIAISDSDESKSADERPRNKRSFDDSFCTDEESSPAKKKPRVDEKDASRCFSCDQPLKYKKKHQRTFEDPITFHTTKHLHCNNCHKRALKNGYCINCGRALYVDQRVSWNKRFKISTCCVGCISDNDDCPGCHHSYKVLRMVEILHDHETKISPVPEKNVKDNEQPELRVSVSQNSKLVPLEAAEIDALKNCRLCGEGLANDRKAPRKAGLCRKCYERSKVNGNCSSCGHALFRTQISKKCPTRSVHCKNSKCDKRHLDFQL